MYRGIRKQPRVAGEPKPAFDLAIRHLLTEAIPDPRDLENTRR